MFSQIITVWKKEIKDTIRDRRTLTATIIIPMVLMPLLIIGTGKLVEYQMKSLQEQTVTLSITGENYAQDLVADIKKQNGVEITKTESQNAEEDVKNGVIDGALIIPPSFEQDVKGLKPVQVNLLFKSTSGKTASIEPKIDMAISNFNNQILKGRFLDQKINPTILSMVSLLSQDVATSQEKSGFGLGLLLPVFIVIWSITGGQYTAIDASAGEKERKTLEALLLTPARRIDIVLGKFLAVATIATTSVIVSISSLYLTVKYAGFVSIAGNQMQSANSTAISDLTSNLSLDPKTAITLLFISFLLVCLFSAILLSIAIFAKSFKEAQSYLSPMYLVIILPVVFANIMTGFTPGLWAYAFPGLNAILLFKEILTGIYNPTHIIVTTGSLILYSLIAIFAATKIYGKESVLFKS